METVKFISAKQVIRQAAEAFDIVVYAHEAMLLEQMERKLLSILPGIDCQVQTVRLNLINGRVLMPSNIHTFKGVYTIDGKLLERESLRNSVNSYAIEASPDGVYLHSNFPTLDIQYQGYAVDDEGYVLLPNVPTLIDYLILWITYMLMCKGVVHPTFGIKDIYQLMSEAEIKARSACNLPSYTELYSISRALHSVTNLYQ